MTRRDDQAGVTLVEMLVSLALFALIGGAGFAVLDQVMRAQARSERALEALGDLQRAMHLLAADAAEAQPGTLAFAPGPGGIAAELVRGSGQGRLVVRYGLEEGALVRRVTGAPGAAAARQVLVGGVGGAAWEWLDAAGQWRPADTPSPADGGPAPRALALTLVLAAGDRTLRRVLPLLTGDAG